MNKLIIIGAGGHGKVIADNALKNGYEKICFVDDHVKGDVMGFPIIRTCDDIESLKAIDITGLVLSKFTVILIMMHLNC